MKSSPCNPCIQDEWPCCAASRAWDYKTHDHTYDKHFHDQSFPFCASSSYQNLKNHSRSVDMLSGSPQDQDHESLSGIKISHLSNLFPPAISTP